MVCLPSSPSRSSPSLLPSFAPLDLATLCRFFQLLSNCRHNVKFPASFSQRSAAASRWAWSRGRSATTRSAPPRPSTTAAGCLDRPASTTKTTPGRPRRTATRSISRLARHFIAARPAPFNITGNFFFLCFCFPAKLPNRSSASLGRNMNAELLRLVVDSEALY